jgi:alpha-beta hydrolase superfamily lysophospholipase
MAENGPETTLVVEPTARGARAAPDGTALAWARWDRPEPVGRVVILHGYGEHGERYAHIAAWLWSLGWSVSSMDQRGFGRSGGPRGDSQGLQAFVDDLRRFVPGERLPERPLVLLAHSFGGLVALAALAQDPTLAAGAILSSPSLVLRSFPRSIRLIRKILLRLAPHLSLDLPNNKDLVCSDPDMVARYWADPLCHRRMTAAYSQIFAEGLAFLLARADQVVTPLLVLEAGEDTVADPDAARAFWEQVPAARLERHRLAGFRHEVFHDLRRQEAQALATEWLKRQFPAGPGNPEPLQAMRG